MKPIFAIVRALPGQCPACDKYSSETDSDLRARLAKDGRFTIVDIIRVEDEDRTMVSYHVADNRNVKMHPDFKKFVLWWPNIIIFAADGWYNHDHPLVGFLHGGEMDYQTMTPNEIAGEYKIYYAEEVIKWAERILVDNTVEFKTSKRIVYRTNNISWGQPMNKKKPGFDSH